MNCPDPRTERYLDEQVLRILEELERDIWQVSAKVTVKPYDPDEWAALLAQCDDTKLATMEDE